MLRSTTTRPTNELAQLLRLINSRGNRSFSTTQPNTLKLFVDNENRYAHQILQAHPNYNTFRQETAQLQPLIEPQPIESWSTQSSDSTLSHLKWVAQHCRNNEQTVSISDDAFDAFIDHFTKACFTFSDDQLLDALKTMAYMPETNSLNTKNFVELWNSLDDACVERIDRWDIDRILLICDHWYILNLGKVNKFNWKTVMKLGRRLRRLEPHHLVQTMFYCNLMRSPVVEMIDFEVNMVRSIGRMNIDEIAVMCMGFFKTQTSIKSTELIMAIYGRLQAELDTVQDISFVNIIKALRYSSRIPHMDVMLELLDRVCAQIPRFSLLSCLHIILLGTDIQVCHTRSIETALKRFAAAANSDAHEGIRLKDMERISFALSLFDFKSDTGIEHELSRYFLTEVKNRVTEIMKYPRCFPSCLHYLSMRGYADAELISSVLDEQFLKLAYGRNATLGREVFSLDAYTQISMDGRYAGNRLADKRRRTMGKILCHYIPVRNGEFKTSATDKILLEIKETVDDVYGHCHLAHVLPHFDRPGKSLRQ